MLRDALCLLKKCRLMRDFEEGEEEVWSSGSRG